MSENNKERRPIGPDKESFAPVAAVLVAALGGALALGFAILNIAAAAAGDKRGLHVTAEDVIFIIVGALNVLGCIYMAAAVVLSGKSPRFRGLLPFVGAPFAVAFILQAVGGIMRRGQYTTVIEILFAIFALIAAVVLAAVFLGGIGRKRSFIMLFGLTGIGVVCTFIPVLTGNWDIVAALKNYIPCCLILVSSALLAVGADNAEVVNERR